MIILFSYLGLAVSAVGAGGAFARYLSPLLGFYVTLGGVAIMALMFFPAILSFFRRGPQTPWASIGLGAISLGFIGFVFLQASTYPYNDVTTNLNDPPKIAGDASSSPASPLASVNSLPVKLNAEAAFPIVDSFVSANYPGWQIVSSSPGNKRMDIIIESPVFHFIDDLAIEVRSVGNEESLVEIRSRSRVGKSDLGSNTKRIEKLKMGLALALAESTGRAGANVEKPGN